MCVCVCVFVCVCVCVYVYICMYVCMYVCMVAYVLQASSGRLLRLLAAHTDAVIALEWAHAGAAGSSDTLVSASSERPQAAPTPALCSLAASHEFCCSHQDALACAAISGPPSGRRADRSTARTAKGMPRSMGHRGSAPAFANGRTIGWKLQDGALRLWDVTTGASL